MSDAPGCVPLLIREAGPSDLPAIVEFNRLLALETEAKVLDPDVLARGVAQALADPDRIRYWVATIPGSRPPGRPGCDHPRVERLAQRLDLVVPERLRRRSPSAGKESSAHSIATSATSALAQPDVIGLRLYVEDANERAQKTYQALGMKPGGYSVYQDLWIERAQRRSSSERY